METDAAMQIPTPCGFPQLLENSLEDSAFSPFPQARRRAKYQPISAAAIHLKTQDFLSEEWGAPPMANSTVIFPHVPRTLSLLKSFGLRTAIVSTKFRYRIEGILAREGLIDSFEVIVGGEDVDEHKPNPEGLHLALSKLKVKAADSFYVGDHPVDAEAAERADVPFIAVLSGSSVASDFDGHPVLQILSSLAELPMLSRGR